LTRLKNRESVPDDNVCAGNPVAAQFANWGRQVGVRGTPAIVMPDGAGWSPGTESADDLMAAFSVLSEGRALTACKAAGALLSAALERFADGTDAHRDLSDLSPWKNSFSASGACRPMSSTSSVS
jgi:hypothetical protein